MRREEGTLEDRRDPQQMRKLLCELGKHAAYREASEMSTIHRATSTQLL